MQPDKLSLHVDSAVMLQDLVERFGPIPKAFEFCFVCKAPATYILCCKNETLSESMQEGYTDQAAEALSQYLRAQFQTDFEIPVCNTHLENSQ